MAAVFRQSVGVRADQALIVEIGTAGFRQSHCILGVGAVLLEGTVRHPQIPTVAFIGRCRSGDGDAVAVLQLDAVAIRRRFQCVGFQSRAHLYGGIDTVPAQIVVVDNPFACR